MLHINSSYPLISQQMAEQLMTLAYENGINLFDTAEVYAAGKWVYPVSLWWKTLPRCWLMIDCESNQYILFTGLLLMSDVT